VTGNIRRSKLIPRGAEPLARRSSDVYLVFVATEDTHAAKQYLDALQQQGLVDRSRVEIVALPTTDGRSSLGALVDRLKERRDALDTHLEQDEYWAVFDVDRQASPQNIRGLTEAMQNANNRGQRLAGSNPCFELWLLLHVSADVSGIPSATDDRHAAHLCAQRLRDALLAGGSPSRRAGALAISGGYPRPRDDRSPASPSRRPLCLTRYSRPEMTGQRLRPPRTADAQSSPSGGTR
jgi:hypothetical protein